MRARTLSEMARDGQLDDGQMTTIAELEFGAIGCNPLRGSGASDAGASDGGDGAKFEGFGWIRGVFIRCVLCIVGATLFLRMSWIAGQAGLLLGSCIVALSCLIVTVTSISMSAIATNGVVKTGGIYYMISRSLGPEFGGSIGLILYVANAVNASMNCVGLAETIVPLIAELLDFHLFDNQLNDVRVYALVICLLLQLIIFIGTEFENKTQLLLMATIGVSIGSHFIGTLLPISEAQSQRGIVGYSLSALTANLWPNFGDGHNFIELFGVYFPAMTGIMAGANMSGDLRDPSKSIPVGTFSAIALTTVVYAWCMFIPAATTLPNASGDSAPVWNATRGAYAEPACAHNDSCRYGLRVDYQVMTLQGAPPALVTVGIFATTLSSASGCLIGAPRIFQALCDDELFPYIKYFAKGHGATNDPFRAYFLTFFITCGVILIGDLNAIAVLITNFFLAAFAITNFACFDASTAHWPGFRPGFHYYNPWLSLFGAILCILVMFILSWQMSLITLFCFLLLFLYLRNNKSHINWGSSTEANRYRKALTRLLKITQRELHVKNYRPQLLVLCGNPAARKALIDFADCITNGQNLLLCAQVIPHCSTVSSTALIRKLNVHFTDWLHDQHIKAFYCAVASVSLRAGVQTLLQTVGLGKMQPNILLIGYNNQWIAQCRGDMHQYVEYAGVISDAFENNLSVCVFRNENEGLDHSALLANDEKLYVRLPELLLSEDADSSLWDDLNRGVTPRPVRPRAGRLHSGATEMVHSKSDLNLAAVVGRISGGGQSHDNGDGGENAAKADNIKGKPRRNGVCRVAHGSGNSARNPSDKFRTRVHGGVVDVWWLFDDGGMTLLLSYLLTTQNTYLPNAKMRVFTICSRKVNADRVHENLKILLKKFRIYFTFLKVFVEDDRELYAETLAEHAELLRTLNPPPAAEGGVGAHAIPAEILAATAERTLRYLRHRELLLEYSSASSIVIITLPLATPTVVCSAVYMMWLELLSRDLPPTLFVRGNQTSVITYYS